MNFVDCGPIYDPHGSALPFLHFWFEAIGFALFVLPFAGIGSPHLQSVLVSSVLGCFLQFQKDPRLNILFLYPFCVLQIAELTMQVLQKMCNSTRNPEARGFFIGVSFAVFLLCIASSLLGFMKLRRHSAHLYSDGYSQIADWLSKNVPMKAVFMGNTELYNPITLAGMRFYVADQISLRRGGYNAEIAVNSLHYLMDHLESRSDGTKVDYLLNIHKKDAGKFIPAENTTRWEEVYTSDLFSVFFRNLKEEYLFE